MNNRNNIRLQRPQAPTEFLRIEKFFKGLLVKIMLFCYSFNLLGISPDLNCCNAIFND